MESSKPESKTILASWTKNCDEIDVALKVILAASQSIHDGVTRLNLVYKADPSEAASESMSKEIGGFCQQMVASLTLLSSVGASKAMVDYFSIGVRAILHSVKDLIEALLDPSRHAHLNGVTGMVWQSCKELQQAPKTNKLACRRQMMQWSVSIKDTIDEFVEAAKTAALANAGNRDAPRDTTELDEQFAAKVTVGGKESGEEGGGGFDDLDFDDMDEDYSTVELQCVQASIDILRVFRRCLKVANESFNSLDSAQSKAAEGGAAAGASREGWLKAKLEWAKSVQRHLEDANECAGEVGILLYPPLAGGELLGRANDLEKSILGFCDVFFAGDEGRDWAGCREAALKAREYAWEQLHSGPAWQSVAKVHRDAYGVAGTLVAAAIFLSGEEGSLDQAVFTLDLVAMMAGGRFQGIANTFVDAIEANALTEAAAAAAADTNERPCSGPSLRAGKTATATHSAPLRKKAKHDQPTATPGKPGSSGGVRRIKMPPLDVFQRDYMETATPVILSGVLDGWPAMGVTRNWSNPSYIRQVAGRRTVPVEFGGSYTSEGWRQELMTIGEFIGRFIEPNTEDGHLADIDEGSSDAGGKAYLAQHQLFDQIPALRRDIMTPDYCALLLGDEEDDRDAESVAINAWFGPAGTVSPLHNDPFHNLLAQVVGTKRVLLVDRKLSESVYPRPGLMSNTSEVDAANPDLSKHPRFEEVLPLLECELRKGEVLYIPPLFWHHIESLEVSFSVSFWWGKRRTL
eukprot:g8950.t1